MRLIEAEPLIEFFEQKRTEWFDLDIGTSTAYDIAKQAIEEEPTVEAIPIEWLKENLVGTEFHFGKGVDNTLVGETVWQMIVDWWQEDNGDEWWREEQSNEEKETVE